MKLALVTVLALVSSTNCGITPHLFSDEHIESINSKATTWEAGRNFPEGTTLAQLKRLLGAREMAQPIFKHKLVEEINEGDIPETFDARQQWPKCKSISEIRDQSACGSCWAVSVTSVISDRICIKSNGQQQSRISATDLISCCEKCGAGCSGGYPALAWQYWKESGIVSGGEYGSGIGCEPYPFPQCGKPLYTPCPNNDYPTPSCTRKCSNETIKYNKDIHKAESVYMLPNNELQIQKEILTNGPVQATFRVFFDFYSYKSGVYQMTQQSLLLGKHAVRVIGWGKEKGLPYWLATNSWNEGWADNGLFKIRRGNNECGFEEEVTAGLPQI